MALLMTTFLLALLGSADPVRADLPDVIQIENVSQPPLIAIRIIIRHAEPTLEHYVDALEVIGSIDGYSSGYTFTLQPQTSELFAVEVQMDVSDAAIALENPNVKARAHCTFHGWSTWSQEIVVPEFSIPAVIAAITILSTILTRRLRARKNIRIPTPTPLEGSDSAAILNAKETAPAWKTMMTCRQSMRLESC